MVLGSLGHILDTAQQTNKLEGMLMEYIDVFDRMEEVLLAHCDEAIVGLVRKMLEEYVGTVEEEEKK